MTLTLSCNYQERYILEGSVVSLGGIQRQYLGQHSLNEKNIPLKNCISFGEGKRKLQASYLGRSIALIIRMLKSHFIFSIFSALIFWKFLIDLLIHEWGPCHFCDMIWTIHFGLMGKFNKSTYGAISIGCLSRKCDIRFV